MSTTSKQKRNPKKDRYLAVTVTDEDYVYARKKNKYACGIVRAIQRQLPEALRVTADKKSIRFSLPDDGVRYEFATPQDVVENVIKPLDLGWETHPYSFQLVNPVAAWPIKHMTKEQKKKARTATRINKPRAQARSVNPAVSSYNRFKDDEVSES